MAKAKVAPDTVRHFLMSACDANPSSIVELQGGRINRAFEFRSYAGNCLVLRLGTSAQTFEFDHFASQHFSSDAILLPKIHSIGPFDEQLYFCISDQIDGRPIDQLGVSDLISNGEAISRCFSALRRIDTTRWRGFGRVNLIGSSATHFSWQAYINDSLDLAEAQVAQVDNRDLYSQLSQLCGRVRRFVPELPECRHLLHGDITSNLFVGTDFACWLIDWAQAKIGDPLYDTAHLSLWLDPAAKMGKFLAPDSAFSAYERDRIECYKGLLLLEAAAFGATTNDKHLLRMASNYLGWALSQ